jgi:hypothetical protein
VRNIIDEEIKFFKIGQERLNLGTKDLVPCYSDSKIGLNISFPKKRVDGYIGFHIMIN